MRDVHITDNSGGGGGGFDALLMVGGIIVVAAIAVRVAAAVASAVAALLIMIFWVLFIVVAVIAAALVAYVIWRLRHRGQAQVRRMDQPGRVAVVRAGRPAEITDAPRQQLPAAARLHPADIAELARQIRGGR